MIGPAKFSEIYDAVFLLISHEKLQPYFQRNIHGVLHSTIEKRHTYIVMDRSSNIHIDQMFCILSKGKMTSDRFIWPECSQFYKYALKLLNYSYFTLARYFITVTRLH